MVELSFAWRLRLGSTERRHLDFLIDGESLFDALHAEHYDLIGRLGWEGDAEDVAAIAQLLLKAPPPIPPGRHMLFVCPECGDLGCGALTAEVALDAEGHVVWRDFAYENNYDPAMTERDRFRAIGPLIFDSKQYTEALRRRGA